MRKQWLWGSGFLLLLTLIFFTYSSRAQAAPDIKVTIDGKTRTFETPVQIANDRVMVPIRFVIEDEALQGQVYWDGKLNKVAIDCWGKYIELFIGSVKASVDGKEVLFDAPPYISNNRTYIPLRFLAESLGATVNWNSRGSEVTIDLPWDPVVMPYYYMPNQAELSDNAELFTDIAFSWFEANEQGELNYAYQDNYAEMIALARSQGLKTQMCVVLMGKAPVHQLLYDQKRRTLLIGNILERLKNDGYDGVNIDFELIAPTDGYLLTTFLRELNTALGDYTLSAAVYARTAKDNWPTPYQYEQIGQIVDQVVVMAYDYHHNSSDPGSIAPLWWVEQVADYMCSQIPREKILLGMPTYGYDWPTGKYATAVTARKLDELKRRYTLYEAFDQASMSPHYNYWDENGVKHQVWLENQQSLQAKVNVARSRGLGGISFWRLGTGFEDIYRVLEPID